MTKTEFNDLYNSLCYGHDAEIMIGNSRIFIEWNNEKIEIFHIIDDEGFKVCEVVAGSKFDVVQELFNTCILEKTLNDHYQDIEIIDIE